MNKPVPHSFERPLLPKISPTSTQNQKIPFIPPYVPEVDPIPKPVPQPVVPKQNPNARIQVSAELLHAFYKVIKHLPQIKSTP